MTETRQGLIGNPGGSVTRLDEGLWIIDLGFQGRQEVITAYLLAGGGEVALVETGPTSTLPALIRGINAAGFEVRDLTAAFLTHIHLDHAGAAGVLARDNPNLAVYVHPFGAPHMIDPEKLIASATRIYGDRMEPLWGEIAPVPEDLVRPLKDGETVSTAGRTLTGIFTPGHANHHIAYWDAAAGIAFTGDVGGIRMPGTDYVCAPTPPPELDPAAWAESVARLRALNARRLLLTHYGPFEDVGSHLDQILPHLDDFVAIAEVALERGADQEELTRLLHEEMAAELGNVPEETLINLEWATPSYMAALGLTRFISKRAKQP
jgi:glyoxylase-like metal-dependent hydrolase (beta-lactamase superfamily II)